jgi:protein-tyrosine phosphatase
MRRRGQTPAADVHFHLLPGVDDGPTTLEESVELARAAAEEGTATIVATPHVRPDYVIAPGGLPELVDEVREALRRDGIVMDVRLGGELGHEMVWRLSQAEIDSLAQGLPGARWLLVETPFEPLGHDFHAATDELRARGFVVVLAHPERSADAACNDLTGLRRELMRGAAAQVNALSLCGLHGEDARRSAFTLVGTGLATVVASDAHGPTRPPALRAARLALVRAGVDPAWAYTLTAAGPARLLARGLPRPAALAA